MATRWLASVPDFPGPVMILDSDIFRSRLRLSIVILRIAIREAARLDHAVTSSGVVCEDGTA